MRKALTILEVVVIVAILAIIAAVLFPVFGRSRGRDYCQSSLKQIGLGVRQYTLDYDEVFPLVSAGGEGWMKTLQPYVKSTQLFQCGMDETGKTPGTNDYFYNARLAGLEVAKLTDITATIQNGDGLSDSSTNAHLVELPFDWITDTDSPAHRHYEGTANYLYVDGHVKMLKPQSVTTNPVKPNTSTFAVK